MGTLGNVLIVIVIVRQRQNLISTDSVYHAPEVLCGTSYEPQHDKTNKITVRPAKTQSDQSLRCPHEESLGP